MTQLVSLPERCTASCYLLLSTPAPFQVTLVCRTLAYFSFSQIRYTKRLSGHTSSPLSAWCAAACPRSADSSPRLASPRAARKARPSFRTGLRPTTTSQGQTKRACPILKCRTLLRQGRKATRRIWCPRMSSPCLSAESLCRRTLSSTMLRIIREEIHGAVLFEWKSNIIIWELLYGRA